MKRQLLFAVLCSMYVGSSFLNAQETDTYRQEMQRWEIAENRHLARLLELHFNKVRANVGMSHVVISKDDLLKHPNYSLSELRRYAADGSDRVRHGANGLARMIALEHRGGNPIRKVVVNQLVHACFDQEGVVWQSAARWLLEFDEQDFSSETWGYLADHVIKEPVRDDVLLVVGVAEVIVVDKWLMRMAPKHLNAVLALARMGHDEYARQAVEHVDAIKDERQRVSNFLERLAYTRHPIALEYIAGYLDRTDGAIRGNDFAFPPYRDFALRAIALHFPGSPIKGKNARQFAQFDEPQHRLMKAWVIEKLAERRK